MVQADARPERPPGSRSIPDAPAAAITATIRVVSREHNNMKVTFGWRRLASAGAVAAVTACGGGGGGTAADGGGATPSPAPVPTTLAITADNMAHVASLSTGWAENVLW